MKKRLQISQEKEISDWKWDLRTYLLLYNSTPHSTTGVAPSALMFGRVLRDKLPSILNAGRGDIEEVLDRDREKKIVGAEYADKRRHAQPTQIELGDVVVAKRMVRDNKLSSNFNPEELQVVGRNGSDVTLKSSVSGKVFHRNVTHVKKVTPSSDENIEDRVDSSENRRAQNDPIELSAHGRPRRESRTPGYLNEYQLGLVEDY